MTRVKICGLTRVEDAVAARDAGADFLGLIFIESSPRFVTVEQARAIVDAVRGYEKQQNDLARRDARCVSRAQRTTSFVGVFADADVATIERIVQQAGLDLVQLHGREDDALLRALSCRSIKALSVGSELPPLDRHPSASWLLFDTKAEGRQGGGTGRTFDWKLLQQLRRSQPFFLAGGIGPQNIREAVTSVRPDGVDLCSGVESAAGIKDHQKIRRLFEELAAADREPSS